MQLCFLISPQKQGLSFVPHGGVLHLGVWSQTRTDSFREAASEFSGNNDCEHFSLDGQARLRVELEGFRPVWEMVTFLFWTGIKWTLTLLREVLYLKTFLQIWYDLEVAYSKIYWWRHICIARESVYFFPVPFVKGLLCAFFTIVFIIVFYLLNTLVCLWNVFFFFSYLKEQNLFCMLKREQSSMYWAIEKSNKRQQTTSWTSSSK